MAGVYVSLDRGLARLYQLLPVRGTLNNRQLRAVERHWIVVQKVFDCAGRFFHGQLAER